MAEVHYLKRSHSESDGPFHVIIKLGKVSGYT